MVQRANVLRDQFPAETLLGMPPSFQYALITAGAVGVAVITITEMAVGLLGMRRLQEIRIPRRSEVFRLAKLTRKTAGGQALGENLINRLRQEEYIGLPSLVTQIKQEIFDAQRIPLDAELYGRARQAAEQLSALTAPDPVTELRSQLAREPQLLGLPLDQRRVEAENVRNQLNVFFLQLPAAEQQLAVEFITRIKQNIEQEEARVAAAPPPPPAAASPYAGMGGVSMPPPPPGWQPAPPDALPGGAGASGADKTVASVPLPPRASIVPTPPGSAASLPAPSAAAAPTPAPVAAPVVLVPPPPPPAKEPSIAIKMGRAIARGAVKLVGRGRRLPPPLPAARIPVLPEEFQRVLANIREVQVRGRDKERAKAVLEDFMARHRLTPEQKQKAREFWEELNHLIEDEKQMNAPPNPQLQARVKQLGDELSVAIMGQGGIPKDEATVVIQGMDQQIRERWQEIQTLLAGETQDSVNETKAIMAGELWESAPTVNIDQKLASAFGAFIKKAKKADLFALDLINRYFNNGHFRALLNLLKRESVIKKLGIAEDERYEELLQLLSNYTAGSGGK
jgi:hypothetical protein